jgi:glycosyltransferase involved in cell wall biosynthesis
MKVAIYTIAKNEEAHVARWAESCKDADYRLILDTGSTDSTTGLAHEHGVRWVRKQFVPWRFDTARNAALSLLPDDIDICIALDMDEVLAPGWREALEALPDEVTRPRYKYIWSWNKDGSEGLVYGGDKIHSRHGYEWVHPVHEVLRPVGVVERQHWVDRLEIHHHPDHTKSRAQYFDLLKLAVEEKPNDDRNQYYLGREYFYHGDYGLAQYHLSEFLRLSNWPPERASARRMIAKMRPDHAEGLLYLAVAEDPSRRENWVALAKVYYDRQDWASVRACCEMVFRVEKKPLDYLCDAEAWGWLPHDLMALASYHLGDRETAWFHGVEAVALAPDDERLRGNLRWYRE